ncbi:MAG: peptide deformylase, partial [Bacteroidetes bacterium]|nr:peptide deformylase [Bacteroidota bacterium]
MILSVVSYGNSILKNETAEIGAGYPGLSQLISDMYETMYAASGVGLAAPQVNHSIRLFVVDASPFAEDDPFAGGFKKTFINAVILERSGKEVMYEEGCLSFPGFREEVIRPETIRIRYMDEQFQQQEDTYSGMLA